MAHGKPCVKVNVFTRHMANHVSTCMEYEIKYKWEPCVKVNVFTRHMANHVSTCMEYEIKYKWEEISSDEGAAKKKRNRERKIQAVLRRSEGQNLLDQGVKSEDLTRGYASEGRDSSYFGLFLAFGLLFWADFGAALCHVNGMGRVCSQFKRLLSKRIWVENLHLQEFPKCSCNPQAH